MLVVKCTLKIRNSNGVIAGYKIQDASGNVRVVSSYELKRAIKRDEISCENLQLTKDNRLVDKKDNLEKAVVKSRIISGARDIEYENATYRVRGGKILLKEVHIIRGEFEIPSFVNGIIYDDSDDSLVKSPFNKCIAIRLRNKSQITDFSQLFEGCQNLEYIDLSKCDMSNIEYTSRMFYCCFGLKRIIMNGVDMSNVKKASLMFFNCYNLKNIDFSKVKFKHIKDMSYMFCGACALETACLDGISTEELVTMNSMFRACPKITNISMKGIDTHNLESMENMFWGCKSLRSISFPGFDVSNVNSFEFMFAECKSLCNVDLSNFKTNPNAKLQGIFDKCNNMMRLDIRNFSEPIAMREAAKGRIIPLSFKGKKVIPDWLKKYIWR